MFSIDSQGIHIDYMPEKCILKVKTTETEWKWAALPFIRINNTDLTFDKAECRASYYKTGIADGVRAVYKGFKDAENIAVHTFVWFNPSTRELNFEVRVDGDRHLQTERLCWPASLENADSNDGYTILPRMLGTLITHGSGVTIDNARIQSRDAYMSFFGQVASSSGYIAVYDTPFDAGYTLEDDKMSPYFIPSLGTIRYKRRMIYHFYDGGCDYVKIAKAYRRYMMYHGKFVTLMEKIDRNPSIARLIGTPVIEQKIAHHISKKSDRYDHDDILSNNSVLSFADFAEKLKELNSRGLSRAFVNITGWSKNGYQNLHPDILPPNEKAGGANEMRMLIDTCRNLGFAFGIHDEYRDYYYDADTFALDNGILTADGGHPYTSDSCGGPKTVLCSSFAPDYVRRNCEELIRLGIKVQSVYLDSFASLSLDECINPDHIMSRETCASYRCRSFDVLTAKGLIPTSDEALDSVISATALCHDSMYCADGAPVGIPIPLFNLVYHDCIITAWSGGKGKKGTKGVPASDNGYMHALLNGGTVYCPNDASISAIKYMKTALDLHRRVATAEMVSHEFIDGDLRYQRTVFSDGTVVEVDFENDDFSIK